MAPGRAAPPLPPRGRRAPLPLLSRTPRPPRALVSKGAARGGGPRGAPVPSSAARRAHPPEAAAPGRRRGRSRGRAPRDGKVRARDWRPPASGACREGTEISPGGQTPGGGAGGGAAGRASKFPATRRRRHRQAPGAGRGLGPRKARAAARLWLSDPTGGSRAPAEAGPWRGGRGTRRVWPSRGGGERQASPQCGWVGSESALLPAVWFKSWLCHSLACGQLISLLGTLVSSSVKGTTTCKHPELVKCHGACNAGPRVSGNQ